MPNETVNPKGVAFMPIERTFTPTFATFVQLNGSSKSSPTDVTKPTMPSTFPVLPASVARLLPSDKYLRGLWPHITHLS